MAKLIVKSPFIKCDGKRAASGYVKYIATRPRVELFPDDTPATRNQQRLISKLIKDYPDSVAFHEYDSYTSQPTRYNASNFITLALEANWETIQSSELYMKYIATRPRVERVGSHGLFGDKDHISLDATMSEIGSYTGNVWTHIISLKREDATRLRFDNASAWRDLIRAHQSDIAAAMKINPDDFRWCAAFHNEGSHPHIHMMAWSANPQNAYLSTAGIEQIKSKLTNAIFRDELRVIYEQKSKSRDSLVREAREELLTLSRTLRDGICNHHAVEQMMIQLSNELASLKGKKTYGYLPAAQKELVDRIIDDMERIPAVEQCYCQWLDLQCQVDGYYQEQSRHQAPLSQQKEFRQIKNAVIHEAEKIAHAIISFEDYDITQNEGPTRFLNSTPQFNLLWSQIRDQTIPLSTRELVIPKVEALATAGDAYAQYLMGTLYQDGSILTPDLETAALWFEKAAQKNHVAAQYSLGKLYLMRDTEMENPERGITWLTIAAQNGNSFAAYQLGKEYLSGKHIEKDIPTAVDFFEESARDGNQYAQYMLGKLYLTGKEVPYDKATAAHWLSESATQGHQYAEYLLNHIDEHRSPSAMLSVSNLLHHMGGAFCHNSTPARRAGGIQIDRKRLAEIREKRMSSGQQIDDSTDSLNFYN